MLLAAVAAAHAAPKAAIFPFELNDVSLEGELAGPRADETQRLALATEELRRLAARDAGYDVLDLAQLAPDIAKASPLYKCNGCEADIARRAGADIAVTGVVRKVSNLILKVFVFVRDVDSGKVIKAHQADIKGNTDETWLRGVRWLVANGLASQ
jgi:hypothetical protein